MHLSMVAADLPLRERLAARASAISGVDAAVILEEIDADGAGHHAVSKEVGAAIDQAIAENADSARHRL